MQLNIVEYIRVQYNTANILNDDSLAALGLQVLNFAQEKAVKRPKIS